MPANDTPPSSPHIDEAADEDEILNENDMVEVYEIDEIENPEGDNDDDASSVNEAVGNYFVEEEEDDVEKEFDETIKPERDDAKLVFSQHAGGVLCCAFHPSEKIAATGGMDDIAYVWDTTNGNVLNCCKGHQESIEGISFSYNGAYLATADLNGLIQIWKMSDYSLVCGFELDDEFSWMEWHSGANVLIACSEIGMIYMYKIPSGETKMVMSPFGQNCTAGKLLPDGKKLACGYKDGTVKVIDLKEASIVKEFKPIGSIGSISSLDIHKDNNLIICGCDDASILLLNIQSGKIAAVLNSSQSSEACSYVEAVAFCKNQSFALAASGSLDGNLIIWDLAKQTIRHKFSFESSINHLIWHPSLPLVYTSHTNGKAFAYDAKTGNVITDFQGHNKCCLNLALSKDGNMLMTSSEDKTARIYDISNITVR